MADWMLPNARRIIFIKPKGLVNSMRPTVLDPENFAYKMTYPAVFSIILLYNLYISIVVQSKFQTDHFLKIREKRNNSHNKGHI